jgi:SAM-dependent methyltransferase
MQPQYICPKSKKPLIETDNGLMRDDGLLYAYVRGCNNTPIPDFIADELGESGKRSQELYNQAASIGVYRNFLDWLFQTFGENETSFRTRLIRKLSLVEGNKVLITGCGLGDDVPPILEAIGSGGDVYAQDLSAEMVVAASKMVTSSQVHFSINDASQLPFADNLFDGAFHFGGINLFDDPELAIREMDRVVKPGGRVVFGDEGIAPWLKNTEYGRAAINNNVLWNADPPLDSLPKNAADVTLSWVLGNCFYVIDFQVADEPPYMNMDVPHEGTRGGSMRTRYFGQLEGVSEASKQFVAEDAKRLGISIHDWLERAIAEKRDAEC